MKIFLLVVGLLCLATPAQAEEIDGTHRWAVPVVCVDNAASKTWKVKKAVRQWNKQGFTQFSLSSDCVGPRVVVKTSREKSSFGGWTQLEWDDAGDLVAAKITFYPRVFKPIPSRIRNCLRNHTVAHEFGHALGLAHYTSSHSGSAMSYLGATKHCGKLSKGDKADLAELYS